MTSDTPLLGVGLYTFPEAARLLKVPSRSLRRWALGYWFRHEGDRRYSTSVVATDLSDHDLSNTLTFRDLIELRFVAWFRSKNVSMQAIRAARDFGQERFATDHPFATEDFRTDGRRLLAMMEDRRPLTMGTRRFAIEVASLQGVFDSMVEPFFDQLEIEGKDVCRYWPRAGEGRVVIDPRRSLGSPIDAESGVPTHTLWLASKSREPRTAIAQWYGVPEEAIGSAVSYEAWLRAAA